MDNIYHFSFEEILAATKSFSHCIGAGNYGDVFKGELPGQGVVAIKRMKQVGSEGLADFVQEVKALAAVHHTNVLRLFGVCNDEGVRYIVYEFAPNGSVEDWLKRKKPTALTLQQRVEIALGAARGLDALHTCNPPILHRDFKDANCLLDEDMSAKICDFGLARFAPELMKPNATHLMTLTIAGTSAFLDPIYASSGHLSTKSDIYSFGVFLLELVSAVDPAGLVSLAYDADDAGRAWASVLADRSIYCVAAEPFMREMFQLGLRCIDRPSRRPPLHKIIEDLQILGQQIQNVSPDLLAHPTLPPGAFPPPSPGGHSDGEGMHSAIVPTMTLLLTCPICEEGAPPVRVRLGCGHEVVCNGCPEHMMEQEDICPICNHMIQTFAPVMQNYHESVHPTTRASTSASTTTSSSSVSPIRRDSINLSPNSSGQSNCGFDRASVLSTLEALEETATGGRATTQFQTSAVEGIVELLKEWKEDESIQLKCVDILFKIASIGKNKDLAGRLGAIPAIVESMRLHPSSASFQRSCALCLSKLCLACADNKERAKDCFAISALLSSLRLHRDSLDLQEKTLNAIRILCAFHDGNKQEVVDENGVWEMVESMAALPMEEKAQEYGLGALANLSGLSEEAREQLAASDAVQLAIIALENFPDSQGIAKETVTLVDRLCKSRVGCDACIKSNAVGALVDAIAASNSSAVSKPALFAIANMCAAQEMPPSGLDSTIISTVMQMAAQSSFDEPTQLACARVLTSIAEDDTALVPLGSAGAIGVLLSWMRRFRKNGRLQEHSAHALNRLCTSDDLQVELIREGGAPEVLRCMHDFPQSLRIQESCVSIISSILPVFDADDHELHDMVERIMCAMNGAPSSEFIQLHGAVLLIEIVNRNDNMKDPIIQSGISHVMAAAFESFPTHDKIVSACSSLIAKVATKREKATLQFNRDGIISLLIAATNSFASNPEVCGSCVNAIRLITAYNESVKASAVAIGVVSAIIKVLATHLSHSRAVKCCAGALWNIAATNHDHQALVEDEGGLRLLISASRRHMASPPTLDSCFGACVRILQIDPNKRSAAQHGIVGSCMLCVQRYGDADHQDLVEKALHILTLLAKDEVAKIAVIERIDHSFVESLSSFTIPKISEHKKTLSRLITVGSVH